METLCTRVERVARDAPARLALIDGERRIDYAGFWRQARRFAATLRDAGVQTGDRVAIILPNRIEAAVACYGTWLAGGVVVPLNAQARLRDFLPWLQHSGARHVVYESAHRDAADAVAQLPSTPTATVL